MLGKQPFKILLVEDQEEDRKLLAEYLHRQEYEIFLAPNGQAALDIVEKIQPELILLDINMPQMNGYTVLQFIRTMPELTQVPIIFISAAATPEERVKGLKLGAVDYIIKPYDAEEVLLKIQFHLRHFYKKSLPKSNLEDDNNSYQARLNRALFNAACSKFMNDLSDTPNLQELARELRTNTKRLNQAFKSCSNKTPFEYLRELRMLEAKRLLDESLYDISMISLKVGFKSPANFSTSFRSRFNASPSQYRYKSIEVEDEKVII